MTASQPSFKTNRDILNEIKFGLQEISPDTDHNLYEEKRQRIIDLTHRLTFPRNNDLNALVFTQSFLEKLYDFHPSIGTNAEKLFLLEDVKSMKYYLEHL